MDTFVSLTKVHTFVLKPCSCAPRELKIQICKQLYQLETNKLKKTKNAKSEITFTKWSKMQVTLYRGSCPPCCHSLAAGCPWRPGWTRVL